MIETLENKLVWHKTERALLFVTKDYGNGELLFFNNVIGRDEDVIPTHLIDKYIQQNQYLFDEFIEWLSDCVLEE